LSRQDNLVQQQGSWAIDKISTGIEDLRSVGAAGMLLEYTIVPDVRAIGEFDCNRLIHGIVINTKPLFRNTAALW